MRHKKIHSDLYGLKFVDSIKKKVQPSKELRTIDRVNKSFSNYEAVSAKVIESPQSSPKKQETNIMISDSLKLVDHYYQEDQTGYYEKAFRYLKQGWGDHRKIFNQHLNKIYYIEKTMYKKNYSQIEKEIIKEWRKNPVLYNLRSMWYEVALQFKFESLGQFVQKYHKFCQFIGQLAYLFFKGFFTILTSRIKNNDTILDRLIFRTSHFIITETNTWSKLYNRVLDKMIKNKVNVSKGFIIKNFDLKTLDLSPYAINLEEKSLQLPKTADKIAEFNHENRLDDKIKILIQIREAMEEEIMKWQKRLIEQKKLKEHKILDKDDFIGCLIYSVIKGEIPLDELGASVKMFRSLLDDECSNILSKWGCDSYLSDLESVYEYLVNWSPQQKTLETLTVIL